MSHDHLEFTADARIGRSRVLDLVDRLRLVGSVPFFVLLVAWSLWSGSSWKGFLLSLYPSLAALFLASRGLAWVARHMWADRPVRLTARQLVLGDRAVPLHDVVAVEVDANGPVFLLRDGERWTLPRGYRLAPSDQAALLDALRRALAGDRSCGGPTRSAPGAAAAAGGMSVSHDELCFTVRHPVPIVLGLLGVVCVTLVVAVGLVIFAIAGPASGSDVRSLSTILAVYVGIGVCGGIGFRTWTPPIQVRLTARRIEIGATGAPLHDVHSVVGHGLYGPEVRPRDGTLLGLPGGYTMAPEDTALLVDALRGAVRRLRAKDDPEARRALMQLRE